MRLRFLYILSFLLLGFTSQAQIYPVQTFIQVSPPYTSYLPDYSNPSNEQLKVFLTLTDMTVPSHEVKIRFRFEGNGYTIENPTYLNLPPIVLTPGTPYEISGAELAYYLNSSNLVFSGINVSDYENRKVLPEGPCTICVEVLDYNSPNNQVVGNPSCTNVWFANYDPPYLNTPICGSQVTVSDPQQLLFNWSPLNMASPSGMNNVEYVFELFEVRPTGAEPNIVVNSTLPIFMQVTNQSFINYSITEPQLQEGMDYVWRVQVRDNSGRDYFKNQGYSQVCTFTYGNLATSAIGDVDFNLQSEGTGVRQGTAWWSSNSVFDSYVLETRKTGNDDYQWFPTNVMGANSIKINSLEPETEYECRVKGIVGGEESDWSNISVFTTQPQPNYSCGNTTMPATSPDIVPYENAIEGNVFFVGQFEMMTTSITPLNTPGHYSGTGKINIPFALINLNVSFDDILVDDNLTVRQGKVVAISKGIEAWETDYLNYLCLQNSYPFPGVDTITFPTDSTALVQFGDQTLVIDSLPAAVITPDGYTYYIYEDGTYWVEFSGTISEDNLASSDTLKILFEENPFQNYGFDAFENGLWVDSYEAIQLGDGSNYFVPYKSIKPGEEDLVYAKVIAPAGFVLDSISFNCLDGRSLNHVKLNDTIYEITLDQFTAEEEAVYAYWRGSKMGKLNVRAYDEITNEVVLVPVNNASINNQENLNSILNEIYSQAVVTWNMTIDSNFNYADLGSSLESVDANFMTHYSTEMRALRDAYLAAHPEIDNSTYILFVVDQFHDPAIQGYMVRGKNVGFLSANPLAKTIAHELGHGAFGLYHTFPTPPVGSTKNLLDYSAQTHLTKYQWEKIHNWSPTLSFLDDEEEAEMVEIENMNELSKYKNTDGTYSFLAISGKMVTLPANLSKVKFVGYDGAWGTADGKTLDTPGAIMKFSLGDEEYVATRRTDNNSFYGYKISGTTNYYVDSLSCSGCQQKVIVGLPCISNEDNWKFNLWIANPSEFSSTTPATPDTTNYLRGAIPSKETIIDVFQSCSETDSEVIIANISEVLPASFNHIVKYLGEDICGVDILYAMDAAKLFDNNQNVQACVDEIYQVVGGWKLFNSFVQDDKQGVEAKKLYELLKEYEKLTSYYDLNEDNFSTLAEDEVFTYGISKLMIWIYEDFEGNQKSDDEIDCLLKSIDINYRIKILKLAYNTDYFGHFGSDKEQFITRIVNSIDTREDFQKLIDFLETKEGDKLWFWKLYEDCSGGELDEYVYTLTIKLIEFGYYDNDKPLMEEYTAPHQLSYSPNYFRVVKSGDHILYNVSCSQNINSWVEYYNEIDDDRSLNQVKLIYKYKRYNPANPGEVCTDQPLYLKKGTVLPEIFDFVDIRVGSNFQFSHPYLSRKLIDTDIVRVPAFFAYWIVDKQQDVENSATARKLVNLVAAIISVATLEPGPSLAVELIWNSTDIIVAEVEDDILSSNNELAQDILQGYNFVSMATGGYFLIRGVMNVGSRVVSNGYKLLTTPEIRQNIDVLRTDANQYLSHLGYLKGFYKYCKELKMNNLLNNVPPEYFKQMRQQYYEVALNKYLNGGHILHVEDGGTLDDAVKVFDNNGMKHQVGSMVEIPDGNESLLTLVLDPTKKYSHSTVQNGDQVLAGNLKTPPVKEGLNALDPVRTDANVEWILAADGKVYWRLVTAFQNGRFSSYSHIDNWLNSISSSTSKANIELIISDWSDAVLNSLNTKIDLFPGLKSEFIADYSLLDKFNKLESTWWTKYALGGLAKRTNTPLPETFVQMIEEIEVSSLGIKLKDVTTDIESTSGQYLGKLFDEALEVRMVDAWRTGDFSDFPNPISSQLQSFKSQGYEIAIEAKVSIDGKNPIPDYLLIRKEIDPFTNQISYDFASVKYVDAKYLPDVNFSVNQKAITNSVKNTGVANVVALEDIKDVNGNVILGINSSFQIVTVEKLTVDDLMNLIIQ